MSSAGAVFAVMFGASLLFGCAVEASPATGDDDDTEEQDPSSDEARAEAEKKTDQTGGRDTKSASCFAACQNTSMTCTTKGSAKTDDVFLELDGFKGCKGTFGKQTFTIDCLNDGDAPEVCVGTACKDGTFSAFTLGFGDSVCTKNN